MRESVVRDFQERVLPLVPEAAHVALVGGSRYDPELRVLPASVKVEYLGIDNALDEPEFTCLDLNLSGTTPTASFDLVICSQVLEHLWDVKAGIANLAALVRPGGLLWIGCPASNFAHGSPDYFAAGYAPELLTRLVALAGMEVIEARCIGSRRAYLWTHALHHWPTEDELRHPVREPLRKALRSEGPVWKRAGRGLAALKSAALLLADAKTTTDIEWATETWLFARRPL